MAESRAAAVSIVVPVLDDADSLDTLLAALDTRSAGCEVIVVDGGSRDGSAEVAGSHRCRVVHAGRGRASQMNAGALVAEGRWLWFLHADSELLHPLETYLAAIAATDGWGFFPVRLSGKRRALRLVERSMNWRSRLTGIGTGDQGIFAHRALFDRIGGFPSLRLMEDIALSRQLRREKRPRVGPVRLGTSSRRWERDGVWRTVWLMWRLRLAYWCGVSPERLARDYYGPG